MNCKLSIVIPVYNVEKYMTQCLESVLSQSIHDFEVLLVDDGSSDNSGVICDRFASQDKRVKVFHKQNEGVSVARNVGLDNACGEWIVFVDADDMLEEDALAKLLNCVEGKISDIALASTDALLVNGKRLKYKSFKDVPLASFLPIKHYALWGYIFKRSVIEQYKVRFIPGLAYSEDRLFLYTLSQFCRKVSISSDVVYIYRKNEDSVCASKNCVRKFKQHVLAAYYLQKLGKEDNQDCELKKHLYPEIKHVIDLGMYMFISLPFSRCDLKEIKIAYDEFFQSNYFFWKSFILQLITFKRRDFKRKFFKRIHL